MRIWDVKEYFLCANLLPLLRRIINKDPLCTLCACERRVGAKVKWNNSVSIAGAVPAPRDLQAESNSSICPEKGERDFRL